MHNTIKLGDCRILDRKEPELSQRLLEVCDPANPEFQSPEFQRAMKDTRRGFFDTLNIFLNKIEEEDKKNRYEIRKFLSRGQWKTMEEITNATKIPQEKIKNYIAELIFAGEIQKHPQKEKYTTVNKRHGIWEIENQTGETVAIASARFSPETLKKLQEYIDED